MEAQVCKDHSGGPVTIQQCYTAFQILAAGMILSFLGFILEICIRPKLIELMRRRNLIGKVNLKIEKRIHNLDRIIDALQERRRRLELKKYI